MTINLNKLHVIRDNYPNTYQWMKDKANWEHMCLGAILNNYTTHIEKLISQEEDELE